MLRKGRSFFETHKRFRLDTQHMFISLSLWCSCFLPSGHSSFEILSWNVKYTVCFISGNGRKKTAMQNRDKLNCFSCLTQSYMAVLDKKIWFYITVIYYTQLSHYHITHYHVYRWAKIWWSSKLPPIHWHLYSDVSIMFTRLGRQIIDRWEYLLSLRG